MFDDGGDEYSPSHLEGADPFYSHSTHYNLEILLLCNLLANVNRFAQSSQIKSKRTNFDTLQYSK